MNDQKSKPALNRILVPITGTEVDSETMRMACWIAKKENSKLYVMYVITIKRSLPLEAEIESEIRRAEELIDKMVNIAKSESCQVETDLMQAREVAPTIIDECIERKIDMIIMGVKYQRRFGLFNLGNIVPYILKNAKCQVMLYSQYD
jgi:nucleotide-binding universal stress UspA family protein